MLALSQREYPHGTRARYNAQKCRCFQCRRANSAYESQRQRDPRIDAAPVRAHLLALSAAGIGRDAVADVCDLAPNAISRITTGVNDKVRRSVAEKILAVDESVIADHALVDGTETRRLLRELIAEGYQRRHIGHDLIQVHYRADGRVTAITALRVRKLHAALTAEGEDIQLAETPRERILSALRWFDWITAEALFEGMNIETADRGAYTQAISRLARGGEIERRGAMYPFEYRSKRQ